jgi:hypothetical protein
MMCPRLRLPELLMSHPLISRFLSSAVIGALAAGCAGTAVSGTGKTVASLRDVGLPATLCLGLDARTAAAVSRGDMRLQIEVRNRIASNRYGGALTLSLLQADGRRLPVHTFGMQPDRLERGRVAPQRFQAALRETRLVADTDSRVCFELATETPAPLSDAAAHLDVALRWQPAVGGANP